MLYDLSSTTREIAQAQIELAVIPVGATEQHSGHLPLGTDWYAAQALARRIAERLALDRSVYLTPAVPFSLSECHGPLVGTVWLEPATLALVLREVVQALYAQGVRRVLVVNGHGGNFVMDAELCEINADHPDLIALSTDWLRPASGVRPTGRVTGGDIHAGAGETALQLHLSPDLVRPHPVNYEPPVGREFLDYVYMTRVSPDGVWGSPSGVTAEEGEQALERQAERLAALALHAFDEVAALWARGSRT